MSSWAKPTRDRHDARLLAPSLDDMIPADCGVRELDRMLCALDWSDWESVYDNDGPGRPPIHPRLMAGCLIYGLMEGVRSLRDIEKATRRRLDFMWLMDGLAVDHTTLCKFRRRFDGKVLDLFRQMNVRAASERHMTLEELVVDGTRLRADSDRHGARTAEALQARVEALDAQISEAMRALPDESPELLDAGEIRQRIEALEEQRGKLQRALEVARERDRIKREKDGAKAVAVRVPVTDPDAYVLPNKEGGYAPNYTPVAGVDGNSGLIVAAVLAEGNSEAATLVPLIEQARGIAPEEVERVLCDSGFASGPNLQTLEEQGIDAYAPAGKAVAGGNPAQRPDPAQPVPEEERARLPRRGGKLDRAAFIYDAERKSYRCPYGRELVYERTLQRRNPDGSQVGVEEYRCTDCGGCPMAKECLSRGASRRMIRRDAYEPLREELARRMLTEEGRTIYARRAPLAEGVFAIIKRHMGIRRFTRRGRERVDAELIWICIAYNARKLAGMAADNSGTPPDPDKPALKTMFSRFIPALDLAYSAYAA